MFLVCKMRHMSKGRSRSQAAMEYLMTYGWTILIVAIVIVALFQLGLFDNSSLTTHAVAGACQAVHNAAGSNLAGQCNNGQPQFVAQFNGQSGSIIVASSSSLNFGTSPFTVSAWVKPSSNLATYYGVVEKKTYYNGNYPGWQLWLDYRNCPSSGPESLRINDGSTVDDLTPYGNSQCSILSGNSWVFITAEVNPSSGVTFYINGANDGTSSFTLNSISSTSSLDIGGINGYYFPGLISNVQVYNTSLSAIEISALYQEGIGGVPIDPAHIVGWWPLNGNAQDYSGNNNHGAVVGGVSYSSAWASGYASP